jgi:hypothetical protein
LFISLFCPEAERPPAEWWGEAERGIVKHDVAELSSARADKIAMPTAELPVNRDITIPHDHIFREPRDS